MKKMYVNIKYNNILFFYSSKTETILVNLHDVILFVKSITLVCALLQCRWWGWSSRCLHYSRCSCPPTSSECCQDTGPWLHWIDVTVNVTNKNVTDDQVKSNNKRDWKKNLVTQTHSESLSSFQCKVSFKFVCEWFSVVDL